MPSIVTLLGERNEKQWVPLEENKDDSARFEIVSRIVGY